ncbi:MAG TPA: ATP-binding protein, partial [Ramlibacter sp.]|nr:ATP-binding protein [Ramlibacter sp.]
MTDNAEEFLRKLRATFQAEAAELVQAIVSELVQLERAGPAAPGPAAQRILKTLHTLKGAARAVDLNDLELLCHAMEGLCSAWSAGLLAPAAAQFDLLHQACSLVGQLAGQPSGRIRNQALALVRALETLATEAQQAPAAAAHAPQEAPSEPSTPAPASAHLDVEEDGAGEAAAPRSDSLRIEGRDLDTIRYHAEALLSVELELQHQAAHLQELAASMLQAGAGADAASFFEAVRQAAGGTHRASSRLGSIRARLMERVLDAAMVPVSTVLEPLPAMVRNLARSRGKEAVLLIEGDALHIDRRILETVREALLHLVTNAVDHGIEDVAGRIAAGKPAQGEVRIAVEPAGSDRVRITVADDGAGIDTGAVVAAAAARAGADEQVDALAPQEQLRLVLRSGVSTSSVVTPVSGRGVGLAIVAEKVFALDGELQLDSTPGQGCRFELVLPVRVANLRALVVRCGDAEFALPLQGLEA